MRILLFIAFVLAFVGMASIVFILAWMLKKAIQHTNKSEEPETLVTPKEHRRWIPNAEEEDRMRE